jgi:hypothetical protein
MVKEIHANFKRQRGLQLAECLNYDVFCRLGRFFLRMAEPGWSVNDRRLIVVTGSGRTTVGMDLTKQLGRKFCADNS